VVADCQNQRRLMRDIRLVVEARGVESGGRVGGLDRF